MKQRSQLAPMLGQCLRWRATLVRRGNKSKTRASGVKICLLQDVSPANADDPHIDHVWISGGAFLEGIPPGSTIYFDATVAQYKKWRTSEEFNAEPCANYELIEPRNVVVSRRPQRSEQ